MCIAHRHPTLSQSELHRSGRHADTLANLGQRQPALVQSYRLVDRLCAEALPTHLCAVALQENADCPPLDPELITQLVDGQATPVPSDEALDLARLELARGGRLAWLRPLDNAGPCLRELRRSASNMLTCAFAL